MCAVGQRTAKKFLLLENFHHGHDRRVCHLAPFQGRFKRFSAQIDFDPAAPDAGRALVEIDLTSAETGDAQRDTALPQAEWFDTKANAQARFEAHQEQAAFSLALDIEDIPGPYRRKNNAPLGINFRHRHGEMSLSLVAEVRGSGKRAARGV